MLFNVLYETNHANILVKPGVLFLVPADVCLSVDQMVSAQYNLCTFYPIAFKLHRMNALTE